MRGGTLIPSPTPPDPAGPGAPRTTLTARLTPDVIDAEVTEAPTIHLREYLRVLYKHRWLAGTVLGLTLMLAMLATLLTTRTYVATTRLQVTRQSPIQLQLQENVLRVDGEERNVNGSSSFLSTQVAILRSRDLAARLIRAHGLESNELFRDPSGRRGVTAVGGRLMSLLRPRGWEESAGGAERPLVQEDEPGPEVIERVLGYLTVNEVRGTDLVDITFATPNATLSAMLAAQHAQTYIEANDEARLATNVTAKSFLGGQLREARQRLERAEGALRGYAAAHPAVAMDSEQKVESQRIQSLSEALAKAEATRVRFASRYEFLTQPEVDPLAYFREKPDVQKIRLQLLEVQAQRVTMADRMGGGHPDMIALRQQEQVLERQLREAVSQETAAVRAQYEAHRLGETNLRAKIGELEAQAIAQRDVATRYEALKKDADTARALHDSLLKQEMETSVHSELAASNIRVVDRAEVPRSPSTPNVQLNLVMGALLGLFFAVGVTLVVEYFDSSVKSREDVEQFLQLPTLGVIPSTADAPARTDRPAALPLEPGGATPAGVFVLRDPRSVVAEAYRAMRTAVLFSGAGTPPRVLLLTSAGAGEGKTFTSLNLAVTLATAGAPVLLIDADMRRPTVHVGLGLVNDNGLSRYLAGQTALEDAIRGVDVPNLSVMTAGPPPPNPAELIGSSRMSALLEQFRDRYEFVIVDSPPVLPVTDAALLSREVDGVVLVVKGQDTPREMVKRACDQLALVGAHLLGVVINGVRVTGWDGYGYYHSRYYGMYYGSSEPETAEQAI